MRIDRCRVIELPKIHNRKGNLTFIESLRHIPFNIKRVYYIYDVPGGAERGGHAHKRTHDFLIAISGSFDVVLNDGYGEKRFHLNRSYMGLYMTPMIWRRLDNFSSGAVCLVLTSSYFHESDYYRNYPQYQRALKKPQKK